MSRFGGLIVLCLLLSGCGTMANMDGRDAIVALPSRPPAPFGGVANDLNWLTRGSINPGEKYDASFTTSIALMDLPFSIIGDIVTLPWASFEYTREYWAPSDRYRMKQTLEGGDPGELPVMPALREKETR